MQPTFRGDSARMLCRKIVAYFGGWLAFQPEDWLFAGDLRHEIFQQNENSAIC
jgi:hypothetical protein